MRTELIEKAFRIELRRLVKTSSGITWGVSKAGNAELRFYVGDEAETHIDLVKNFRRRDVAHRLTQSERTAIASSLRKLADSLDKVRGPSQYEE